jgi:hypothetical protein
MSSPTPQNSSENQQLLNQFTRDELKAAAEDETKETFIKKALQIDTEQDDPFIPDSLDNEGAEEWLGAIWDEAHEAREVREEAARQDSLKSSEINRRVFDKLEKEDKAFTNFMAEAGLTLNQENSRIAAEDGDADREAFYNGLYNELQKLTTEYGNFNVMQSAAKGKPIDPKTKKRLLTYMKNDPTYFRNLYLRLTHDDDFYGDLKNEVYDDPETGEIDLGRMTAFERGRAIDLIRDEKIREKIKTKQATDEDYEKALEIKDKQYADELKKRKEFEAELAETKNSLDEETQLRIQGWEKVEEEKKKTEKAIRTERKVEEKLQRQYNAKTNAEKRYFEQKEKLKEQIEKVKRTYKEKRAMERLRAENKRLANAVMKEAGASVWHNKREQIAFIQDRISETAARMHANEVLAKLAFYGLAEPAAAHLPIAMAGEKAARDLTNADMEGLFEDALEIAGYLNGVPYTGIKRGMKAVTERTPAPLFGINKDD